MGIVFQKQTVQPQPTPKPSVSPDTQSVTSAESGPLLTPIPDSADLFAEDFEASASLPSLPSTRFSTTSSGASSTSAMGAEIPLPSRLSGAAQALTDAENELGKRREDNERMLKDWKSMLWIGGSTLVIVISLGAFLGYLAISKLSSGWDIFYATHEDKVMEDSAKIDRALEKSGSRNISEHLRKQNSGTHPDTDATPNAMADEAAITELLTRFNEATDLPGRLRCVAEPLAVRTYMMQYYRDYYLKLAKGVVDPPRLKSVKITNRTRDFIAVTARFHDGTDFTYKVVNTADGYRIDWMYGRRDYLLANNIINSGIKQRAWDVILPADAIGYRLRDRKKTDFLKNTTITLGATLPANHKDSKCDNEYYTTIRTTPRGVSESEVVIDIEVTVFKSVDFAMREMNVIRKSAFEDPSSTFYCKEILIPAIGEECFCKQWDTFAPNVLIRKHHTVISVSCRTVFPRANRTTNSSSNLTESIRVARLQAAAVKVEVAEARLLNRQRIQAQIAAVGEDDAKLSQDIEKVNNVKEGVSPTLEDGLPPQVEPMEEATEATPSPRIVDFLEIQREINSTVNLRRQELLDNEFVESILASTKSEYDFYQWSSALRRPTLGVRWGVGVVVSKSDQFDGSHFFPIGSQQIPNSFNATRKSLKYRETTPVKFAGELADSILVELGRRLRERKFGHSSGLAALSNPSQLSLDIDDLGEHSTHEALLDKAKASGIHLLLLFRSRLDTNRLGIVKNLVTVSVYDVNSRELMKTNAEGGSRKFALSNIEVETERNKRAERVSKAVSAGVPAPNFPSDPVDKVVERVIELVDSLATTKGMPDAFNKQNIARRLATLSSQDTRSKLERLSEGRLYQRLGFVTNDEFNDFAANVLGSTVYEDFVEASQDEKPFMLLRENGSGELENKLRYVAEAINAYELALDQIENNRSENAVQTLQKVVSHPYARERTRCSDLLSEAVVATSDLQTLQLLVSMSKEEFSRTRSTLTINDGRVKHVGLLAARKNVVRRNIGEAYQIRIKKKPSGVAANQSTRSPQPRQNAHELARRHVEGLKARANANGDIAEVLEYEGIIGAISALQAGGGLTNLFDPGTRSRAQGYIDMYKNRGSSPEPSRSAVSQSTRSPQPRQNAHELARRHVEGLKARAQANGDIAEVLEYEGIIGAISALQLGGGLTNLFDPGTRSRAQGYIDMYKN
jgi:hypothetical protein